MLLLENASAAHLDSPSIPAKLNVNVVLPLPSTIPTPSNVLPAPPQESGTTKFTLATAPLTSPTEIPLLETADLALLFHQSGTEGNVLLAPLVPTTTLDADAAAAVPQEWPTTQIKTPALLLHDHSTAIISFISSLSIY